MRLLAFSRSARRAYRVLTSRPFLLVLLLLLFLPGCKRKSAAVPADSGLVAAFRSALAACTVDEWGHIVAQSCRDPLVAPALAREEHRVGPHRAMLAYCGLMAGPAGPGRSLSSYRISLLSSESKPAPEDLPTSRCLEERLERVNEGPVDPRLVRTLAVLGTALGREADALKVLSALPEGEARRAGYGALWANGRLRVWGALSEVLASSHDPGLTRAVIEGFGGGDPPSAEERAKICEVLRPFAQRASLEVASAAVYRMAQDCPGSADSALQAAERKLAQRQFDLVLVRAVRVIAGAPGTAGAKDRRAPAAALLEKVLGARELSDSVRREALLAIFALTPERGRRLAQDAAADPAARVREAAARILRTPAVGGARP